MKHCRPLFVAPCAPVSARRCGRSVLVNRFRTFARNRQNGFVALRNCFVKTSSRAGAHLAYVLELPVSSAGKLLGQLIKTNASGRQKTACGREFSMKPLLKLLAAASVVGLGIATTPVSAQQPIRIGVPTAMQLQVGRDTQDAAQDGDRRDQRQGRRARPQARDGRRRRDRESRDRHRRDQEAHRRRKGRRADRRLYQRRDAGAVAAHLARPRRSISASARRRRRSTPRSRPTTTTTSTSSASARSTPRTRRAQLVGLHLGIRQGRARAHEDRDRRREREMGAGPRAAPEEGRGRRRRRREARRILRHLRHPTSRRCSPRSRIRARST